MIEHVQFAVVALVVVVAPTIGIYLGWGRMIRKEEIKTE